jgi:CDP-paratose 2-epimerase
MKTVLITGGAGFVGSNLAIRLKQSRTDCRVLALDNLKRRGSELSIHRLRQHGVEFVHGDIRNPEDLAAVRDPTLIIECAAEPSVLAGISDSPSYVVNSNLVGTVNCLELARQSGCDFVFLSTSRVYPIDALNNVPHVETELRFEWQSENVPGITQRGVTEQFPLTGVRSLYGATKLASELLLLEYSALYGFRSVINRCGVIAGPWQMGKVDQGVLVHWVARHHFGGHLDYIGFGGAGKQVRDVLHIDDLFDLVEREISSMDRHNGAVYNVGGGRDVSFSLRELTVLCEEYTGRRVVIGAHEADRPADIRIYMSDSTRVEDASGWTPQRPVTRIIEDVATWIRDHERELEPIFQVAP